MLFDKKGLEHCSNALRELSHDQKEKKTNKHICQKMVPSSKANMKEKVGYFKQLPIMADSAASFNLSCLVTQHLLCFKIILDSETGF